MASSTATYSLLTSLASTLTIEFGEFKLTLALSMYATKPRLLLAAGPIKLPLFMEFEITFALAARAKAGGICP